MSTTNKDKVRERTFAMFARLKKYLDIAETLASRPDLTTIQIGEMFGVTQTKVSQIGHACDLQRRLLFTVEQDNAILRGDVDPARVGRVGQQASEIVRQRRNRLQRIPRKRRRAITPAVWDALRDLTDQGLSVKETAAQLELHPGHVGTLRQYLPLRQLWLERHPCRRGVCCSKAS